MNQSDTVSITNEIFQKKSLVEIRTIEAKLRSQVKEKREDLRQTVGEQYRNVIDSGENVCSMRNNCINIRNSLSNLTQRLNANLKDTLKKDCNPSYDIGNEECEYSQGLAQLYNTPSGIWSALANGKFFKATILYVKSQQFIFKFKLLELDSDYARSLFVTSPVLCDHVHLSHSLEASVLTHTINGLGRTQNPESLTENLIALQIMRNCTTEEIFRDFLHSRASALRCVFEIPEQGPPLTTRQQLTEISQLLISTLYDIKCIFFPNKSNNEILINLIKHKICVSENIFHLLDNSEADVKFIQTELKGWIENVENELEPKIAESLVFVPNAKGLTSIRDFILDSLNQFILDINLGENPISESHDFLKILCIEVIGESKDIWEIFIGNPLLAKMESLIGDNFREVVNRFSSSLDECVEDVFSLDLSDFGNSEVNLANFLWNFNENSEPKTKNLISQVLGCTPNILKLCQILDNLLESLQNEIQNFITPIQTKKLAFSLPDYSNQISHLLQSNCSHALSSIITLISDKIANLSDSYYKLYLDSVPTQPTLNTLVFLGRLGVNIRENCKILESILDRKESDQWKANKTKLIESTRPAFGPWIHQIIYRTSDFLTSSLEEFTEISHLSLFSSEWPEVIIEEEREDGQKHETTTCLPTKPSPILYQTIFIVCQEIHRIVLSDQIVLQQLSDTIITRFIEIYKKYIENSKKKFPATNIPQNLSLQLLFDVKWLLNVVPHSETTPAINRDINTVIVLIEDAIDPFDLDVYKPYIHTAIQTQLQLNSVLFGSFTSLIRKQIPKQQQLTPQAPHFESKIHNIVPLAPNISRFILLPVSSSQKPDSQTKTKLTNTKIESSSTNINNTNINYIDNELYFFASSISI